MAHPVTALTSPPPVRNATSASPIQTILESLRRSTGLTGQRDSSTCGVAPPDDDDGDLRRLLAAASSNSLRSVKLWMGFAIAGKSLNRSRNLFS